MNRNIESISLIFMLVVFSFFSCEKEKTCGSCLTGNDPPISGNKLPVAIAGADQRITLPTDSIFLDGSASNDPDGNITTWQWTQISGPSTSAITNNRIVKTQVRNLTEGTFYFELKVSDAGRLIDEDTLRIVVLPPTVPALPIFVSSNAYIAGWGPNASGKTQARIWHDGTAHNLSDGQYDASARSVFKSGSDLYVAGLEKNAGGKSVAMLWKNGVANKLTNGQFDAEAISVFVYGNDVYVAGYEINAGGKSVATLWKNGVTQALSNGQNYAKANSVYVANNGVYVTGFDGGSSIYYGKVTVWENGVAQILENTYNDYSNGYSVFVSASDVYVAGFGGDEAKLWKNGVPQNFTGSEQLYAEATSVFVSGNDVNVAGTQYPCAVGGCANALYWKNGHSQILPGGASETAFSVFVSGADVFVAGSDGVKAKLWKNGIPHIIPGLREAYSVFVQ